MHIGLDDDGATPHATKFYHSRHAEGLDIIASGNVIDARRFLCRGCPPSLRAVIWSAPLRSVLLTFLLLQEVGLMSPTDFIS